MTDFICEDYTKHKSWYYQKHLPATFVPKTGIKTSVIIGDSSPKLALLLSKTMDIMNDKKEKFIIDSAHIMPHDILKYIDREKWDIVFLGYSNTTAEAKIKIILEKDDEKDWSRKKTYDELYFRINALVGISKTIQEECEKFGLTFVDTSNDFDKQIEKITNQYFDY